MKMRIHKCIRCESKNTRNCQRATKLGFEELLNDFPNSDQSDYILLAHICDDCNMIFYTKAKIEISYLDEQDILLDKNEAIRFGIM